MKYFLLRNIWDHLGSSFYEGLISFDQLVSLESSLTKRCGKIKDGLPIIDYWEAHRNEYVFMLTKYFDLNDISEEQYVGLMGRVVEFWEDDSIKKKMRSFEHDLITKAVSLLSSYRRQS